MPFQLRRIGKHSTIIGVRDIMRLTKDVTRFGRHSQNDYFLDSAEYMCLISRWHAEIHHIDQDGMHKFILRDNGLNGTYVNDVRVDGNIMLEKGDIVTFGHPNGKKIKPGEKAEQEVSEFQFILEDTDPCINDLPTINATTSDRFQMTTPRVASRSLDNIMTRGSPVIPMISSSRTTLRPLDNTNNNKESEIISESEPIIRNSPHTTEGVRQETPLTSGRIINNNNVSRKLITDTDGSSTFVLKDISNTGSKNQGLVHLDQLFATHNSIPTNPNTGTLSAPIAVESSDDDVYRSTVSAIQQFADDSGSDEDIFVDNKQDQWETQPAEVSPEDLKGRTSVSQLQMHLQMPLPTTAPQTVYPSLSSIFERPSQLTTTSSDHASSSWQQTFTNSLYSGSEVIPQQQQSKGRGRGKKKGGEAMSHGQLPALCREDSPSGKKRKRTYKKHESINKRRFSSLPDDIDELDEDSESEMNTWHYDGDQCDSYDCCTPTADKVSWVQCDDCDKWYHTICAGTSYDIVKDSNAEFHCGCN